MTTPYLELASADGALSAVLMNGNANTSYMLTDGSWQLAVSGLNDAIFAPVDRLYYPCDEELSILIRGSSAADCYAKLQTLTQLMQQAEQHSKGGAVSPVLLKYAPNGSTTASDTLPYVARVLGRTDSDRIGGVQPDTQWDRAGYTHTLPVRLRFSRTGAWVLANTNTATCTAAYCETGTISFGDSMTAFSPTSISTTIETGVTGYVVLAPSGHICRIDATAFSAGSGSISTVTDSSAVGGSVARWTLGGGLSVFATGVFSSFTADAGLVDIFATVKSSSADTMIRCDLVTNSDNYEYTPWIPLGSTDYQPLFLGTVSLPYTNVARAYSRIDIQCTGAVGATVDCDNVYLIARSRDTTTIKLDLSGRVGSTRQVYTIDPNVLDTPIIESATGTKPTWYGQLPVSSVPNMQVLYLMTGTTAVSGKNAWRPSTTGYTWTVTRYPAYLMPV